MRGSRCDVAENSAGMNVTFSRVLFSLSFAAYCLTHNCFSSPSVAVRPVCVWTTTLNRITSDLDIWFTLTLCGSSSKVKVHSHRRKNGNWDCVSCLCMYLTPAWFQLPVIGTNCVFGVLLCNGLSVRVMIRRLWIWLILSCMSCDEVIHTNVPLSRRNIIWWWCVWLIENNDRLPFGLWLTSSASEPACVTSTH